MNRPSVCLLVLLALSLTVCSAKEKFRILGLFPHPGKSHFDVFAPLVEELALRGHEVTVVSHFPRKNELPNYKDIALTEPGGVFLDVINLHQIKHSAFSVLYELGMLSTWGLRSCEYGLRIPKVRELINSDEKFDLILTETFNSDCFLGFVHKFKAPFIALSSHQIMPWGNDRFHNPDNPSYIPSIFHGSSPRMSFMERVLNTLGLMLEKIAFELMFERPVQAVVEKAFGPGVPPLKEIARNTSAFLVNIHYTLHGSRPELPNIVEVGGLHIRGKKALPRDIKEFLDGSPEGVLLFSLGSMIKAATLPEEKLSAILKVIKGLPKKVIWKWEVDDLPGKPDNLLVRKWLPQLDILSHPNVKGYLGHGGLLGLSEAVHTGVPMVVVPMYGDQHHNGAAAAERGMAVVLPWEDFAEDTLRDALNRIFNDTSYYKNAQALSRAYRDRPATALETAVWWAEFVARNNGLQYLRSSGADLPWYQYHLLDVIAFVTAVCLIVILSFVFIVKKLLAAICGRKEKKTSVNGLQKKKADQKTGKKKN